jgi:hypothetical protein
MAANENGHPNPVIWKTSDSTNWVNMTGTGLPSTCSSKCLPRDIFYDPPTGLLYVTILGNGGQPASIYRTLVQAPSPGSQ